jgi:hypothetical protein
MIVWLAGGSSAEINGRDGSINFIIAKVRGCDEDFDLDHIIARMAQNLVPA